MNRYEKLGVFYLGKKFDLEAGKPTDELILYPSRDLTTHAVCVGMTGSGKTGLCLSLLEEAAIDGIPVLAIDPKGDLGNLLLAFPELKPADFEPWIDPEDAARKSLSVAQLAEQTADQWRKGLAEWDQPVDRVQRYRDAVDIAIYTPGSTAGLPLALLKSFQAPPASVQGEAYRDRLTAAVSGLLVLMNLNADPITSREFILLSNILDHFWKRGQDLDTAGLIRAVQQPPLQQVGVMDMEAFYPSKDRFGLAMSLNNLISSPSFADWLQGEPLDVSALMHTPRGKPRLSILSIAHLGDVERMFFVSLLLNEVLSWMRGQSGTSSLRGILYMDEVFGYFPPSANPPSKVPMLTLLKQARAYGLGIVLATQNPVDLDYKGLANTGTWFLGRLQTERDKMRVLDGLEGAANASGTAFHRQELNDLLGRLGKRVFLMNNVHDHQPVVFQSRWALSYLRGPLSREQIKSLMERRTSASVSSSAAAIGGTDRPLVPPGVVEKYVPMRGTRIEGARLVYRPGLFGAAKVHFANAKAGIDIWSDVVLWRVIEGRVLGDPWGEAEESDAAELEEQPEQGASFCSLPPEMCQPKNYQGWEADLKQFLFRTQALELLRCDDLKATSQPDETERDFRVRLTQSAREARDRAFDKLQAKYAPKLTAIDERIRKANQRVEKEAAQAQQSTVNAALSFGSSLLSAFTGRKAASTTNINRATSAARQAQRALNQRKDVDSAQENVESLQKMRADLDLEFQTEAEKLTQAASPDALRITSVSIKPRKSDIMVERVILVWSPWWAGENGMYSEAF